jgi:hypothetical protein
VIVVTTLSPKTGLANTAIANKTHFAISAFETHVAYIHWIVADLLEVTNSLKTVIVSTTLSPKTGLANTAIANKTLFAISVFGTLAAYIHWDVADLP